jgi:hypothetical protein
VSNPTVLQKVLLTFTPKDAAGNPVDLLANPTALTELSYVVDAKDVASVNVTGPYTAELVPSKAGAVKVSLSGKNVLGEVLTESLDPITFEDVAPPPPPVPVVKSLNLVAGEAVAK